MARIREREAVRQGAKTDEQLETLIMASLDRRPQTAAQLSEALGVGKNRVKTLCSELVRKDKLIERREPSGTFYHGMRHEMRD